MQSISENWKDRNPYFGSNLVRIFLIQTVDLFCNKFLFFPHTACIVKAVKTILAPLQPLLDLTEFLVEIQV